MRFFSTLCLSLLAVGINANLSFITVGDWGAGPESGPLAGPNVEFSKTASHVAQQMGIVAASMSPSLNFVFNVGDNFYSDGIQNRSDPIFNQYFSKLFTDPALASAPWYGALGNHDYNGDITAQYNRQSDDARWYLPSANYTLELNIDSNTKATVVVLDTNPFIQAYFLCPSSDNMANQLTDPNAWKTQIDWLDQVLSTSTNAWKVVMAHHTIFASGHSHCYSELQSSIQPLLEKYNVAAYFSGHFHDLEVHNNNNVDYFISGGASQVDWSSLQKAFPQRNLLSKSCKAPSTAGDRSQNPLYTPDTLPGNENGVKLPGFMASTWTASAITTNVWTYMNSTWLNAYTRVTPLPTSVKQEKKDKKDKKEKKNKKNKNGKKL